MADVHRLRALLAKVEACTTADRAIDVSIACAFPYHHETSSRPARQSGKVVSYYESGTHGTWTAPEFTRDLRDAVGLVERVLPGWWWKVGTCSVSDDACIAPDFNSPEHGARLWAEIKPQPGASFDVGFDVDRRPSGHVALALIEAFLTAVIALEHQKTLPEPACA